MKQQSQNKAKRWFAWLGGGVIILCLAAGGFWYWINIPPQVDIPTPVMPNPNGYDYFVRAAAAYVEDSKGVDELTDSHVPMPGETNQYPIAAKEAWLKKNAKAFLLLREGLKYPALYPPVWSETYSEFRALARALVVESHVRAARGDWCGAADSMLDGLAFGYDIPRGGPLIAGLVGNAVRAISFRELYKVSSHLDAKSARYVARRIEHLYAGRFPYFKTLQEEKWAYQAKMLELMKNRSWRLKAVRDLSYSSAAIALLNYMFKSDNTPSRLDTAKAYLKNSKLFFISNKTLMKNYNRMMDAYIANGQMPYTGMRPIHLTSSDPLTEVFNTSFMIKRWNWARMNAYSVLDMTMLALRVFRIEKGYYPSNLKELVPEYLRAIPTDPFNDKPLHYQLQGKKYLLRSVGSDGVDNHGTPIINRVGKYAAGAKYRLMDPDSKGDVVAGVNVP